MVKAGRSRLWFAAAGLLALVTLSCLLILDMAGRSVDASSLPVILIGQSGAPQSAEASEQAGPAPDGAGGGRQGQGRAGAGVLTTSTSGASLAAPTNEAGVDSAQDSTAALPGSFSTGGAVRETVYGGVHTGTTGSVGSGTEAEQGESGNGAGTGPGPSTAPAGGG
jgi:hypothetical protein